MTDLEKERAVAEKIKKLIALASSPNEAEATAAMEKAQELLAKHNLSMERVLKTSEKNFIIHEGLVGDIFAHKRRLGVGVAKLYFCKHFFRTVHVESKRKKNVYTREQHCFAGEAHNVAVAASMFDYLSKTIDRLAKEAADKMEDKKKYWSFQTAFKTACAQRIYERISDKLHEARTPTASSGGNLPALASLYDRSEAEVEEFLASLMSFKNVKTKAQKLHLGGMVAGRQAGDSIGLDSQITAESKSSGLLK